jgi:hypothetical protein
MSKKTFIILSLLDFVIIILSIILLLENSFPIVGIMISIFGIELSIYINNRR